MHALDFAASSAGELARRIATGDLTSAEVVAVSLARIAEVNPLLNCFCSVWEEEAPAAAVAADAAVAGGDALGPLHGVPIAVKDTTPIAGHRTTLGSYTHESWIPDRDAWIVGALRRAGAIIVGTTTSPEFAWTLVTESPLWGVTRNPWDLTRTPGGSSGGSAAAVAAGCVPLAEGTDMGGSVRIPAAWCGIVGLKPGIGRIPMDGLPGLFDSMSHHGGLARSVDDVRLFLLATQGPDDADILSVPCPLDLSRPVEPAVEGVRLALSVDLGCWAVDPAIEAAVRSAATALEGAGAVVEEVEVEVRPRDEEVWRDLWSVFMAGYYGHLVAAHRERMDPGVLRLIERGEGLSAVHMKRLEIERTDLWRRIARVLAHHEAIVCPTMATGPLSASRAERQAAAAGRADDGRYHSSDMTAPFNLVAPCPALSVPCGLDADGMPVGVQIAGRRWREDTVLRIGGALEAALPGAGVRPPIYPGQSKPAPVSRDHGARDDKR
jgi:Asp-tRNA(Asn)/Glu-tRNA(Gln) amidotransferase A subunit family amidase